MPNDKDNGDGLLERVATRLGSSTILQKIRFGGAVGKLSLVAVSAIVMLGVALWHVGSNAALIAIVAIAVITLLVISGILWIVHKHPDEALLEGSELVLYKQITLGAKDMLPPSGNVPAIAGPVMTTPAVSEKPEGNKE